MGLAGAALAASLLLPTAGETQQPVVYPAKGQSPQKQATDQGECQVWAKQSTGIDPVAVAQTPAPAQGPAVGGGQRLVGAAGGAAAGAAIGAIAGDAGAGAGVGAVVGTMAGGRRARQARAQQQQSAEAQKQQAVATYYRAFAACMEARGYAVK
jgi:hypothetical protein